MPKAQADNVDFVAAKFNVGAVEAEFRPAGDDDVAAVEQQLRAAIHIGRSEGGFCIVDAGEGGVGVAQPHV